VLQHQLRPTKAGPKHRIAVAKGHAENGRHGKFVEIIFSPTKRTSPKSLKKMVVDAVWRNRSPRPNSLLTG
jgi:hypothetical protein